MIFTIYKDKEPDKVIRVGYAPEVIEVPRVLPPVTNKQGRKKMADKKLDDQTGTKTIHKDPADKQGPIGTGGDQHPSEPPADGDINIGNQGDDNG